MQPEKTTIAARLNKIGTKLLCGRCGGTLADVVCETGGGIHEARANGRPARRFDHMAPFGGNHVHSGCNIVFGPGWREDPEIKVWKLTNHAQRRYAEDRQLASGNSRVDPQDAARAHERLVSGHTLAFTRPSEENLGSQGSGPRHVTHRAALPTHAWCPRCRGTNFVEQCLLTEATEVHRNRA